MMNKDTEKNYKRFITLVIVAAALLLALHIGSRALWDPDEGRYAEMGREVLALNDWVTPHLNYHLYFEKPMMFTWMEAASQKLFGVNEAASRIPPLACGLGIVLLVWLLAKDQWGRRAALVSSVILITSVEFFVLCNSVDINMALAFFITAAMVFFWLGQSKGKSIYYYLMWISAAGAALTKGPVGLVLPALAVLLYIIITRQFKLILQAKPVTGFLLFLAVTLPWYILVCQKNPDFFNFFIINENLMRYTTTIHHRHQPFWYFIPVILGGFLPWTFLAPEAFKKAGLSRKNIPQFILYLIIWFAVIFLFFTPSQSKLATYILPCFAPLSMLAGYAYRESDQKSGLSLNLIAGLWLIIGVALIIFQLFIPKEFIAHIHHPETLEPIFKCGIWGGITIIAGALAAIAAGKKIGSIPGYAMLGLTLLLAGLLFAGNWDNIKSTKSIMKELPGDAQLYAYTKYFQSSTFYTGKPVHLVETIGELTFGQEHDKSMTVDKEGFYRLMNKDSHIYCLTEIDHYDDIRKNVPDAAIIARRGELALIGAPTNQNQKSELF
jgi:4-amino-4-deoxy-L-arabinose transferase-like glycosyltransferase